MNKALSVDGIAVGTYAVRDAAGNTILLTKDYGKALLTAHEVQRSTLLVMTSDGWQSMIVWPR